MRVFVTGGSGFVGGKIIEALADRGDVVRALARSDRSAALVTGRGASPIIGDLSSIDAMADGMDGCTVVFHAAAEVSDWGSCDEFERTNIQGTKNVIQAAQRAGVDRIVYISTEAVLADGSPLVDVDETAPIPDIHSGHYPRTKAIAERIVLEANSEDLTTVVVRPRLVWGVGDQTFLPTVVTAVRAGDWRWVEGGHYRTSTCHVQNLVYGLLLAAESGVGGEVYFLTDGEPAEFREFVTALLRTQGVDPGIKSLPRWLARGLAVLAEIAWKHLPLSGDPFLNRTSVAIFAQEMTVNDSKAREKLTYEPPISIKEGIAELSKWDVEAA